ncbi:hypothetical protein F5Y02DRAFT_340419 [Annulohypoxylon stygium]|nr:hypothetical protein F5Y02DRAFT_340419 [Annulohypoxylon stygium]
MEQIRGSRLWRYLSIFSYLIAFSAAVAFVKFWGFDFLLKWSSKPEVPQNLQIPLVTDIAGAIDPFWVAHETIFDDSNAMAPLFTDVAANSKIIDTMMESMPLSREPGPNEKPNERPRIFMRLFRDRIKERRQHIEKAKDAFITYASIRQMLLRKSLSDKFLWHWYSDNVEDVKFIRDIIRFSENKTDGIQESWIEAEEIVRDSAFKFMDAIGTIWHQGNASQDLDKALFQMNDHLERAAVHEDSFVRRLSTKSRKGHLWSHRQTSHVLTQLRARVTALQDARLQIQLSLIKTGYAYTEPPGKGNGFETYEESAIAWARAIDAYLTGWEKFVFGSDQGVLFVTRREHLKDMKNLSSAAVESSWEAWKGRNCGGTSCYEEISEFPWLREWWYGPGAPPVAERTLDENAFCKKLNGDVFKLPKVPQIVYDQACCQQNPLATFIKYAPADTLKKKDLKI